MADTELTNYKSGIDLVWGVGDGSDKGTAYAEEYLYYSPITYAEKIVYIKSNTLITASHNSRNLAGDSGGADAYVSVGTSQGTVKYRVDGDHRHSCYPTTWAGYEPQNHTIWPAYTAPFNFDSLTYAIYGDAGVSVVGSTGDNGVAHTIENKRTRYYRGMLDSVGDEWHTLAVADDDSDYATSVEYYSSDGKIVCFVVNPKTPAIRFRVTGTGQFYTTPAKKYFIPKIYDQTTVIVPGTSGTVTCELRNIYGDPISYRVNGGDVVNVGAASVILDDSIFTVEWNILEYWYTATPAVVKTRIVIKNPPYPSADEVHGDRFWVSSDQWTNEVLPRLNNDPAILSWVNGWKTSTTNNQQLLWEAGFGQGKREIVGRTSSAAMNAVTARINGMTATRSGAPRSYIDYAKIGVLENGMAMGQGAIMGYELNPSNHPLPSRELRYRGYYDVKSINSMALAYDIIAGYYRQDQGYSNGLTVCEDFLIRDMLANWVHCSLLNAAGYEDPDWGVDHDSGMWPTARKVGAMAAAIAMPSYSTPYFGTCGLDGGTAQDLDTPFPDIALTWKQYFWDTLTVSSYPNLHVLFGWENGMLRQNPAQEWGDKLGYSSMITMGNALITWGNWAKMYGNNPTPYLDYVLSQAAIGQFSGNDGTAFKSFAGLQNSYYSDFRTVAQPTMLSLSSGGEDLDGQINPDKVFTVLYYNHNFPFAGNPIVHRHFVLSNRQKLRIIKLLQH